MTIARIAAAAIAAGTLALAGTAAAAPALNLGADTAGTAASEATPVHHYGYYHGPRYYPYYGPYAYVPPPPPPPRYYTPYYGYPMSGISIRTPGLRLGIRW